MTNEELEQALKICETAPLEDARFGWALALRALKETKSELRIAYECLENDKEILYENKRLGAENIGLKEKLRTVKVSLRAANENLELHKESRIYKIADEIQDNCNRYLLENKCLRAALEWYADEKKYIEAEMTVTKVDKQGKTITFGDSVHYGYPIGKDKGARARAALKQDGGG